MQNDIEDNDLEKKLIDNFIQDQNEEALDEYQNDSEGPDFAVLDEELADPRAYPHPKPWGWVKRINISCTIRCTKYHYCRIKSYGFGRCQHPSDCNCNKFAWEENQ